MCLEVSAGTCTEVWAGLSLPRVKTKQASADAFKGVFVFRYAGQCYSNLLLVSKEDGTISPR